MPIEEISAFLDKLRSLIHLGDPAVVAQELESIMPEDLADAVGRLDSDEAVDLLSLLPHETAAAILVELPTDYARPILRDLPDYAIANYLDILPMDDAIDLREDLGDQRFNDLLEIIPAEDALEIRRLMAYPEDAVGRIMTEKFFEVGPNTTMAELLADIREASDEKYETVNDVYVISSDRHLLGLFSLRRALRAELELPASEIMRTELITVAATDDAEEAARKMARYGFYALPVIDARGRMVGIFTGDDAQEILQDAETEDVLALGAVSGTAEDYLSLGVRKLALKRLPWLMALFVAEWLTGYVMRYYGGGGEINPVLFFLPLLIGAGGNSGSQTTTMVTRAIAVGEVRVTDWLPVLSKEFRTALLVGAVLGVAGYARALLWKTDPTLAIVVGLALPMIVIWSTSIGSLLPLGAKRLGFDPAVMSAPFISTFVDATGLIIYFEMVKGFFHGHLGPI